MNRSHLMTALLFVLVGYALGIFFPSIGQSVSSKVSGLIG